MTPSGMSPVMGSDINSLSRDPRTWPPPNTADHQNGTADSFNGAKGNSKSRFCRTNGR